MNMQCTPEEQAIEVGVYVDDLLVTRALDDDIAQFKREMQE
jgi:hypothetical protein